MKKKILFVLIVIIILTSLTVISATNNNTLSSTDNQTITDSSHNQNQTSSKVSSNNNVSHSIYDDLTPISNNKSIILTNNTKNSLRLDSQSQTNSTYYINTSVLSNGNGSKESPWKTITQTEFTNMNNGSTLYIANGNYSFGRIKVSKDITITGENVNNTIIKGSFTISNSNVIINNISFNSNKITSNGGIFDLESSNITIDSSIFNNNKVINGSGSVIYAHDTNIVINNSIFTNNTAPIGGVISVCNGSGSGSIVEEPSNITILNSLFNGNNATYEGGVIYDVYSNLYIKSSNFTNNYARSGGVIYSDDLELSIELSNFSNNYVKNLGGAIYANQNTLSLTSNNFTNNKARTGDDLYTQYNASATLNDNSWSNNNSIAINTTNYAIKPTIIVTQLNDTNTSVLPSKYDLRDYGYVTSVKNQGSDGNCWAFATMATLESCILKATNQTYDLSENNLKNIMAMYSQYGFYVSPNIGGLDNMPISYLVNWLGPVLESDDAYTLNNRISPLLDSIIHITNVYSIPSRNNYTDNDLVKEAIMKYGAVYTGINMYTSGSSSYCPYNTYANHAVCIVGWDDNYSRYNFGITAPGDGAFIIKNSWGTNAGDNGYYYVSYYDTTILQDSNDIPGGGFTFILNDTESYDEIYQYDYGGISTWFYSRNNLYSASYSNEYTITSNETLRAFGTYVMDTGVEYTAKIYVNNKLNYTQTGNFSHIGYETVKLNDNISVNEGDNVKVQLQLVSNSGNYVYIPISTMYDGRYYNTNKSLVNGRSYSDGVSILKLYTIIDNKTIANTTINIENSTYPTVVMKGVLTNLTEGTLNITIYDKETNIIQSKNVIITQENWNTTFTGVNTGDYTVVVSYLGDRNHEAFTNTTNFTIEKQSINTTILAKNITYGNGLIVNGTIANLSEDIVLNVAIGDKKTNVTVNNGKWNTTINDLAVGNYQVEVSFTGDDNHEAFTNTTKVTVNQKQSNTTINIINNVYGSNTTITGLVDNTQVKSLNVTINSKVNHVDVSDDGSWITSFDNLGAGNYTVIVSYNSNSGNYSNFKNTTVFNVSKKGANSTIVSSSIIYGENATITGMVDNTQVKSLNVTINSKVNHVNVSDDGSWTTSFDNLGAGNYTVIVSYNSNSGNYSNFKNTTIFNVAKKGANSTIVANNVIYGENVTITGMVDNTQVKSLNLTINGNISTISVNSNGSWTKTFTDLDLTVGKYNITVSYNSNSGNYSDFKNTTIFNVSKKGANSTIVANNIIYGENATITGMVDNTQVKSLNLTINGNISTISVNSNGSWTKTFDNLNAGNYNITVSYNSNSGNYSDFKNSTIFNVDKKSINSTILANNVVYGDNVTIYGVIDNTQIKSVNITVNREINSVNVTDGKWNFTTNISDIGKYTATVSYIDSSGNYKDFTNTTTFKVTNRLANTTVIVSNVVYPSDVIINGEVANITSGNLNVTVISDTNIRSQNITIINGKWNTTFSGLAVGLYNVTVTYNDITGNYENFENTTTFNISKKQSNSTIIVDNIVYGNNLIVNGTIDNTQIKLVNVTVNSKVNQVNVSDDGSWTTSFDNLEAGNYTVIVSYDNNSGNYSNFKNTTTFNVSKKSANSTIVAGSITYNETLKVNGTTINLASGSRLNVTITTTGNVVDSQIITTKEDGSWNTLFTEIPAGLYNVTVVYNGDENHENFTSTINVTVNKKSANTTISASDIVYGDNVTITGMVDNTQVKLLDVIINDIVKHVTVSDNGTWTTTFSNLSANTYTVTVSYTDKTGNYSDFKNSTTFNVAKQTTNTTIIAKNIIYGNNLIVNGTVTNVPDDTVLNVIVGDKKANVTINNGKWNIIISDLIVGDYQVEVSYIGDNNHKTFTNTTKVSVSKKSANSTIIAGSITYNETLKVNGTTINLVNGSRLNVTITTTSSVVDSQIITTKEDGSWNTLFTQIPSGLYNITVAYTDTTGNYENFINTTTFNVVKQTTNTTIIAKNIIYGDNLVVNGTVTNIPDDTVLNVIVGDKKANVTINDGKWNTTINDLAVGDYQVEVSYIGDNNHKTFTNTTKVTVSKKSANSTIVVNNVTYGENVIINGMIDNTQVKSVNVTVNSKVNQVSVGNDGSWITSFDNLGAGNYTVIVSYNSNSGNYSNFKNTTTFNVAKKSANSTITASNIVYGNSVTVTGIVDNTQVKSLNVSVNGKTNTVVINNGKWITVFTNILSVGSYTATVSYTSTSGNYSNFINTTTFNVAKKDANSTITASNIVYGNSVTVTGIVDNTQVKSLNVSVNGKTNAVVVNNGKWTTTFTNILAVGSYTATVSYTSTSGNYSNFINTTTFNVAKKDANSTITASNIAYGEKVTVTGRITNTQIKSVNVTVNSVVNKVSVGNDGSWTTSFSNLSTGNYMAIVSYNSNSGNYSDFRNTTTFSVGKLNTNIIIDDIKSTQVYSNITIKGKLVDELNNTLNGKNIIVSINGKSNTVLTDSEGNYKFITTFITAGVNNITVSYAGDTSYAKSSANMNVLVNKQSTNTTINIVNSTYPLVVINGKTTNTPNKSKITVIIGNTKKTITLQNGIWSATFSGISAGKYTVTIKYDGDTNHKSFTNTTTLNILKQKTSSTIKTSNIVYGNTLKVSGTTTNLTSATLNVSVGTTRKTVTVKNGTWSVNFNNIAVGNYKVVVSYNGDTNHISFTNTTTASVSKAKTIITSQNVTAKLGSTVVLKANAKLSNGTPISGKITIKINNITKGSITISNGQINYKLSLTTNTFEGNTYKITFIYSGSSTYTSAQTNIVLTVTKFQPKINVKVANVTYIEDTGIITVNITNGSGYAAKNGSIGLKINGAVYKVNNKAVTAQVSNGIAVIKFNTTKNMVGKNNITITYNGNNQFNSATTTIKNAFTVQNKTRVICTVNKASGTLGQKITLSAKFTTTSGKALNGQKVVVKINGKTYGYTTVKNGVATFTQYLNPTIFGGYNYKITFQIGETSAYTSSTNNNILTVTKYTPTFKYTKTTVKVGTTAKITVKITNKDNTYTPNNGTVGIKINGQIYKINGKAVTVKVVNGVATFNIPITTKMKGYNNITFTYNGNTQFNSATTTITNGLIVKT